MNKIFNWTFGSIFRTFGRVIAYLVIGTLFALILSKSGIKIADYIPFGIVKVSAKTVTISSQNYSIRHINMNTGDYIWTSYVSNGTQTTINTDTYYTRGVRTKFYSSGKYLQNTQYQAKIKVNSTPKGTYSAFYPGEELSCYGSISNSSYSPQTSLISGCQLVGVVPEDGNNFTDYYINFTPTSDIETVQFVILWSYNHPITRINVDSSSSISYDTSTQDSINTQTNQLIDNQNNNTEAIIDNQNELMGNKCENLFNKNDYIVDNDGYIGFRINGLQVGKTYTISSNETISVYKFGTKLFASDQNSGPQYWNENNSWTFQVQNSSYYLFIEPNVLNFVTNINQLRDYNFMLVEGSSPKSYCKYGTTSSKLDDTNKSLNDINNSINDDDSTGAQNKASEFFGNFTTNTHGLTGIITSPLNAIQSLASSTCSPLVLPLPFVNQNLTLPCMRQIYVDNFGSFMTIYDVITLGIISYWILVRIFALVKDFKNPDHDEIEVMDL